MNQLDPYHTIAFNLWLDGYDSATLYPSRTFKTHCEAIKAVLGVDVSAPLTTSTLQEIFDASADDDDEGGGSSASVGVDAHSEA